MTAWKAGDRCTVNGRDGEWKVVAGSNKYNAIPVQRDSDGLYGIDYPENLRPIPEPPVDPSKVTVDREQLRAVCRLALRGGRDGFDAQMIAHLLKRVVLLGVVSPDPTSDEAIGVCEACEATGTRYDDEGTILCESCWQECTEPRPSPVAAEAAPPTPAAWLFSAPAGDGYPVFGPAATVHADNIERWQRDRPTGTTVSLWALGEGQAIINTAKFKAECYDAVGNIAPVDRTIRAIMLAFDAALAAASEATP